MLRYDKALITDVSETAEGYLNVTACPITRPGVFPYRRDDGTVTMEAKLPDELFSDKTIQSANAKPITNDHPSEPVTVANYQKYAKGMTHTDAAVKNNKLSISFTVTDSKTIELVNAGKKELSIGFTADVKKETGSYLGQKYDSVQRNMEINHIAIVDQGRAGPSVAIRGDSAAFMIDSSDKNKQGGNNMSQVRIDNKDYEVDSVVKARIDALEAQVTAANVQAGEVDKITGERDGLKTQVVTLEKELAEEKAKIPTGDALDQMVADRMALASKATTFLGDSFDMTGKSDREVKEAVIQSVNKDFKGDGKSDDYVNAFFDSVTATSTNSGFTQGAAFSRSDASDKKTEKEIDELKQNRLNMKKKKEAK